MMGVSFRCQGDDRAGRHSSRTVSGGTGDSLFASSVDSKGCYYRRRPPASAPHDSAQHAVTFLSRARLLALVLQAAGHRSTPYLVERTCHQEPQDSREAAWPVTLTTSRHNNALNHSLAAGLMRF